MATLGELERRVMDVLWDAAAPLSAGVLQSRLADDLGAAPALTTVMTVLSRLERKGLVARDRGPRPHEYRAVRSRAEHMAELMHDVLGSAGDRDAVLTRFVGQVSEAEAATLRRLLESAVPPEDAHGQ